MRPSSGELQSTLFPLTLQARRDIAEKNAQENIEDGTMGSPYLSSNESIILSTNNIIINTVPAEAILTNKRLIVIDARHTDLRPQDIPFPAIETVTIGENADLDPMLSLSIVTGPDVSQAMGMVFPQPPRMKREAERDEWAVRLKELSVLSIQESGKKAMVILPPWVPGPLPDERGGEAAPARYPEAESKFRNPPLAPRKPREPAQKNSTAVAAAIIIIVVALVAGAYLVAPSLFGGGTPVPPVPTADQTTVPTPVATTAAPPAVTTAATVPVTPAPTTVPAVLIPPTGVWIQVKYDGSFSGYAGAPGRFRDIADTGSHFYQLAAREEIVSAMIQKEDTTGRKLTVEIYENGTLVKSGSVTAPNGIVNINTDLRTS
jgi:hypothetical protein